MSEASDLAKRLSRFRFRAADEDELQRAIAGLLTKWGLSFVREKILGPGDRIDFLVGSVGIECKVQGSAAAAMRQIDGYMKFDEISAVVLVTDRLQAGAQPESLRGKEIVVVPVLGGFRI